MNMARKNTRIKRPAAIGAAIIIATLLSACSGGNGPKEYELPVAFSFVIATDT